MAFAADPDAPVRSLEIARGFAGLAVETGCGSALVERGDLDVARRWTECMGL
jgi:hypothetical protein